MKSLSLKQGSLSIILILITVSAILSFSSCKKDEKINVSDDNYYVKYIIKGNGAYGRFSDWTATTPQGTYANNGYQTTNWNQHMVL